MLQAMQPAISFARSLRPARVPVHALVLLGLAAVPMSGCKRRPQTPAEPPPRPTPVLGPVTVRDMTAEVGGPQGVVMNVEAVAAETRRTLAGAGVFQASPTDAAAAVVARVRIEFGLEDVQLPDKGAARAAVRLRIDTRPSDVADRRFNEDVQAGSESQYAIDPKTGGPDRQALFTKLVSRTVQDLLAGYLARQKLWTGDPASVRPLLTADAGELTLEAIRAVGERKLTSETPALLKLLENGDEAVRDAALGALVELRERKAVTVLAEQRSMRDKREMRKILDAIAVLGGEEAADYLGFVADGHEDPEIKAMAAEARRRLLRRADAGAR
jgi:hypothetical protein